MKSFSHERFNGDGVHDQMMTKPISGRDKSRPQITPMWHMCYMRSFQMKSGLELTEV
jgi:hypothetical protein